MEVECQVGYLLLKCLVAFVSVAVLGTAALFKRLGVFYSYFHKPDEKCTRNGGELVAEVLKDHGIKFLFTLSGGHISPVFVSAEKLGIRVIDTRHEVTSVFAADAVARLSGTVGAAVVTSGPGVTNTITAVKNAQMAESPVLLMGGAAATLLKGRGALQDIEQLSLFKSLCKFSTSVAHVRDIVPSLRKAIQIAQSGTPGPVFVELPIDVLYPYHMVQKEIVVKGEARSLTQKVASWYLQMYLNNLFAGAFEKRDMSPLPVNIPQASNSQIQKCVELLTQAKKPLMLIGSQATLPPTPVQDIQKAVMSIGIPVYLGGMARGLLGRNHALQMRQNRKEALREADLVILAGAVCDFRLSYGRVLSRKSKIIAVNRSREQMLKNSDMFWKPSIGVQGDVGSFLVAMAECLKGYSCDSAWVDMLRSRDEEKEKKNKQMAEKPADKHLNPIKVLHELEEHMGDDTVLVADGGDFVGSAAYILRPRGPLRWLDPGAFGTLGVGAGFALGAKLCRPESDVFVVYGDGSLGYSLIEFDTFTRHKVPVIAVVGNDACWTQIAREQVPVLGLSTACNLAYSDYHVAATGLGAKGFQVTADDRDRLGDIILQARNLSREGHSVLINALIGKTQFREGSVSV